MDQSDTEEISTLGIVQQYLYNKQIFYYLCNQVIIFLRSFLFAFFIISLWNIYKAEYWYHNMLAFFVIFSSFIYFTWFSLPKKISIRELLIFFEINFSHSKLPSWSLQTDLEKDNEWKKSLSIFKKKILVAERSKLFQNLSTLVFPVIISFFVFSPGVRLIANSSKEFYQYITFSQAAPKLLVVQGAISEVDKDRSFVLSRTNPPNIKLLTPNLVEVIIVSNSYETPVVVLRKSEKKGKVFQSFKMIEIYEGPTESKYSTYKVSFAVSGNVDLSIPNAYGNEKIANIDVKNIPVPEVSMTPAMKIEEPWHDEKPLLLDIEVKAQSPLKSVKIIIRVGKNESKELVQLITSDKIFEYRNQYSLLLEPYINSDIADVEIFAEAIDKAIPRSLIGYSKPISLRTESAYGRYRHTLRKLRDIKSLVDKSVEEKSEALDKEVQQLARDTKIKSSSTPFFDTLDRIQINSFTAEIDKIQLNPSFQKVFELSHQINEFLVEHEILDDRERDRDFFVAARAISRLIEQDLDDRPIPVKHATENLINFLENRRIRWELRVNKLGSIKIRDLWNEIKTNRPFISAMEFIAKASKNDAETGKTNSLMRLSNIVAKYRSWIEELESEEDALRRKQEQKRQEGLASARKKLTELQKRQGKISAILDQSSLKKKEELSEQWPIVRMKQNTNIKSTKKLEFELRSLSPKAGGRIKAALKSMQLTLESGENKNYGTSESYSDLAGRLLRQAQQESQSSQRGKRRRKRVTGDQYFGRSIHGGDLEIIREYQVDERYRSEILDEVQEAQKSGEDDQLLESYLRKIIR